MLYTSLFFLCSYSSVFWFLLRPKICCNTFLSNLVRFCSSVFFAAQVSHVYSLIGHIITLYKVSLDLNETCLDFNVVCYSKKHLLAEFILFFISLLSNTFNSPSPRYLKSLTNSNSIFFTIKLLRLYI